MKAFFKKNQIRFDGTKEIETKIKNQTDNVISRRFKILIVSVIVFGLIILIRLFMTQIKQEEYYKTKLAQYNTDVFTADTFRGNIYDRNLKRLAYNKNVNCATYYAVKGIKKEEIDVMIHFLIDNIKIDISKVSQRDKKDYLIMKDPDFTDSLVSNEERKRYADDENSDDIIYELKLNRITDKILSDKLSDFDIKYYKLYYTITNCNVGSTVLIEGLSIKEASLIGENSSLLRGIRVTNDWQRDYDFDDHFKDVLGRVTTKKQGLPANLKDKLLALDYNNDSRVGVSGIEAEYETLLTGDDATYKVEYDVNGNPNVSIVSDGSQGQNLRLTIDWDIQKALSDAIEQELKSHTGYANRFNNHIFVTLMDPNNGDIIAMVGKRRGSDGKIYDYASGNYLYAMEMGSTVKGGTIYMAFKNNVIKKGTVYHDAPIKIAGTPRKKSWKNLGNVNEIQALAQSSNVYMFQIAMKLGGGKYEYDKPLSIDMGAFDVLREAYGELGLGVRTGLDVPNEELGYRGDNPSGGNLLDFAIGQYDSYTTIQLAQYVSTIANGGKRIQPHLFLESFTEDEDNNYISLYQHKIKILDDVSYYQTAFEQIQKGFRECILTGTGRTVNGSYQPAGKTGTAQRIDYATNKDYPNHLFVGYAPYDKPVISVACATERQASDSGESCKPLAKKAFQKYFEKYGVKSD